LRKDVFLLQVGQKTSETSSGVIKSERRVEKERGNSSSLGDSSK
jgi:hypothetical protein